MISARVIADSVNPAGQRLTTVEATFNRYILAEVNTHRMLSRNSASSRAIPTRRLLLSVLRDPAVPVAWGRNQAGMQARSDLSGWRRWVARRLFLWARYPAVLMAWILSKVGLHKQITNRIIEPWMWHTAIITATDWDNLYRLRLHPDAQPEFQETTRCIKAAIDASEPERLGWGQWHTPYVWGQGRKDFFKCQTCESDNPETQARISAACCARVSYVRQRDQKSLVEDLVFVNKLASNGHFSPLEHPAQAVEGYVGGNFLGGWKQLRKFYPGEDGRG